MSITITQRVSFVTASIIVSIASLVGTNARAATGDGGAAVPSQSAAKSPANAGLKEDSGQTIARHSKVLAKKPNDATALIGRGKAYVARRDYALALADYDRAVRAAPTSAAAQYGRAVVRLLIQEQSARLLAGAKPAQTNDTPVLDGSQFDDDGIVRAHVAPPAPTLARN